MIYVLDASSILRFLFREAGGDRVKCIFDEARQGISRVLISVENWGEVIGKVYKADGQIAAEALLGTLEFHGLEVEPLSIERVTRAAILKAELKLPYADAICAELAISFPGSLLVTADFDFKPAEPLTRIEFLPAKPKQ